MTVIPWIVAVLVVLCVAGELEQWRRERRARRRDGDG